MIHFKKFVDSFRYAGKGLAYLFRTQQNMRVHVLVAGLVAVAGALFSITTTEWCLLILCMGMVLLAEAFNTATELFTDIVQPAFHPKAGWIKDIAAAAVLLDYGRLTTREVRASSASVQETLAATRGLATTLERDSAATLAALREAEIVCYRDLRAFVAAHWKGR